MPSGVEFGVHEDPTAGGRTPAQVKDRYPFAKWGREFVSGVQNTVVDLRPKFSLLYEDWLDEDMGVIVSVKTNAANTISGSWDTRFNELGAELESISDKVEVVWWHEPEEDLAGSTFVSAFNRARSEIKQGGANVKVGTSSMCYHWAPNWNNTASIGGKTNTPSQWYTGLTTDFIGADVYSGRSFALDHALDTHPGYLRWRTEYAQVLAKPIYLTERGFETPSDPYPTTNYGVRNATINDDFNYVLNTGWPIKKYIFWSSPGTENAAGLVMDSSAQAVIIGGIAYHEGYTDGLAA